MGGLVAFWRFLCDKDWVIPGHHVTVEGQKRNGSAGSENAGIYTRHVAVWSVEKVQVRQLQLYRLAQRCRPTCVQIS